MRTAMAVIAFTLGAIRPAAAQVPPPPGKMVDVGGYKLHVNCTGAGSPTVILEAGASSFSIDWALVQPAVSRTNRVCSYDRAGYGWSEPGPYDFRGSDAVMNLRTALSFRIATFEVPARSAAVNARPVDKVSPNVSK